MDNFFTNEIVGYLGYADKCKDYDKLCENILSEFGDSLANVPHTFKSKELCMLAVSIDGLALEYVPEELRDQEMCKIATDNNKKAIDFVPKEIKETK